MSLNGYQKVCLAVFIILLIFWVILFASGTKDGFYNYLFTFLYGLIPFFGGIAAIKGYRDWGGASTILGRAIRLLGFGLFFWGCGECVWSYYNFFVNVDIPYPSLADLFFAPSVFLYTAGTVYLSRVTGARLGLQTKTGKVFAILGSIAVLVVAYYVLSVVRGGEFLSDKTSIIKSVLDILYPLGDAVSLAVSIVVAGLSFKYLRGLYRSDVLFILFGLAAMFAADSYFSYTTTAGTSYNGDFGDLLFLLAVFLLTCGLLGFNKIKNKAPVAL